MKSVQSIIDAKGGLELLPLAPIRLENPPYMPLNIEHIGTGSRGGQMVAVHHSKVVNGDLCFDPELTFEVIDGEWHPVSFEVSGQVHQEAVFTDATTGKLMVRPKLVRDLKAFARMWDKNIRDQGFVKLASE